MPYGQAYYNEEITIWRETANVYGPSTVLGSVTGLTLSPNTHLRITLAGFSDTPNDSGSGTVIVVGTDSADAAQEESMAFFVNGQRSTRDLFKTVTGYRTSGLTTETAVGTIEVEKVGPGGSELIVSWTKIGTTKGRFSRSSTGQVMTALGNIVQEAGVFHTRTNTAAAALDRLVIEDGSEYEVVKHFKPRNRFGYIKFYRYSVKELESPAN